MKTIRFIRNKAGDMGIGAMIVFIAMVLVAGIAASVLVQTANKLEIQAMTTGQETTAEVATGIGVDDICGHATTGVIDMTTIAISPRSGSRDIDLSKVTIEVSDANTKIIVHYSAALYQAMNAQGIFATAGAFGGATTFGVIVLNDADGSCLAASPVLNRGDHVLLTLDPAVSFNPGWGVRTDIWGLVIPEEGSSGIFAFRTPSSMPDNVYDLY
jgi:archaeal flagellin FlaB